VVVAFIWVNTCGICKMNKCVHVDMNLQFNPLKPELNPIYYLLALLGAHHFLHVAG